MSNHFGLMLLHVEVKLLELVGDRPKECLEMVDVVGDYCHGCFESTIRVCADCCGKGAKLLIKFVFKIFHGLSEVSFGDERIGVGGIVHCLDLVCYGFFYGCVCEADCRVAGVRAVYISPMRYEVYTSP